jgi:hypothetical protein
VLGQVHRELGRDLAGGGEGLGLEELSIREEAIGEGGGSADRQVGAAAHEAARLVQQNRPEPLPQFTSTSVGIRSCGRGAERCGPSEADDRKDGLGRLRVEATRHRDGRLVQPRTSADRSGIGINTTTTTTTTDRLDCSDWGERLASNGCRHRLTSDGCRHQRLTSDGCRSGRFE